jgi:hypothetical protein
MFGRKSSTSPEDPAVGPVEALLNRAATYREVARTRRSNEPLATASALWICACVTMDDAPTWLIYEDGEDGMAWSRISDKVTVAEVVAAGLIGGGHAVPGEVLAWLQGEVSDPWAGGGAGTRGRALDRFGRALRRP